MNKENSPKTLKSLGKEGQQEHLNSIDYIKAEKLEEELKKDQERKTQEQIGNDKKELVFENEYIKAAAIEEQKREVFESLLKGHDEYASKDSTLGVKDNSIDQPNVILVKKEPQKQEVAPKGFLNTISKAISNALNSIKGGVRKGTTLAAFGLMGATATAGTVEQNSKDSTDKNRIEKSVDLKSARKVSEIPKGYEILKKDNKTYGIKFTQGKNGLEMAKAGPAAKNEKGYEEWIINQLQSGVTLDELVEKKYITKDKAEHFKKHEKSSTDVVYMESGQEKKMEPDPFSKFSKNGEILYAPGAGGHAVAEMFYPVRLSKDIKDGGSLNTSEQDVLIRLRNDFGFVGGWTIIKSSALPNILGGTKHFISQKKLDEVVKASSVVTKDNTYEITEKDVASK